ncbi:MAG: RDD family protein [Acidobacteria bacterium]|nr:RDD family protein [Acidobacteriota bacterium]
MTDAELQKNRFIALAIDIGAIFTLVIVIVIVGIIGNIISSILGSLVQIAGAAILCGFILLRDFIVKGNSIGKHLMKIKVVTMAGGPIELMHSVKRNLVYSLTSLIWLLTSIITLIPFLGCIAGVILSLLQFVVGLAVLAFAVWEAITITKSPEGLRWSDTFAGTRVVRQ